MSISGNSSEKLHSGNVVNMPYWWYYTPTSNITCTVFAGWVQRLQISFSIIYLEIVRTVEFQGLRACQKWKYSSEVQRVGCTMIQMKSLQTCFKHFWPIAICASNLQNDLTTSVKQVHYCKMARLVPRSNINSFTPCLCTPQLKRNNFHHNILRIVLTACRKPTCKTIQNIDATSSWLQWWKIRMWIILLLFLFLCGFSCKSVKQP